MDNLADWDDFMETYLDEHGKPPKTVALEPIHFIRLRHTARVCQRLSPVKNNFTGMNIDGVDIITTRKKLKLQIIGVTL